MNAANPRSIACIGGASVDRRCIVSGPLRPGTSNPVVCETRPGGVARNVAEALARLGCDVALFSIVGEDEPGRRLLADLRGAGVDTSGVRRSSRHPTGDYTAVLGPSGRLEFGLADMAILDEADPTWAEGLAAPLADRELWFVDSNLSAETIERLLAFRSPGTTILADPVSVVKADRLCPVLPLLEAVFPDRQELERLTRMQVRNEAEVAAAAARLLELGPAAVIVTLGAEGVYVADRERREAVPPIVPHGRLRDPTGAGDALIAGYIYGLVTEEPDPVRLGLAAASVVLESGGALSEISAPSIRERARAG